LLAVQVVARHGLLLHTDKLEGKKKAHETGLL
jgi:hypothetical protein